MKDYKKEKDKLLELKKKLLILGLLTTGSLTLTSCTNATGDSNSYIVQESLQDEISSDAEKGSTKTFESGEHYLCVQIPQKRDFNGNEVPVKAIDNIPDGYNVYEIVPYQEQSGYGSKTGGYYIWFVNDETVEVTATYNDYYKTYGYYTFGEVVNEKTK